MDTGSSPKEDPDRSKSDSEQAEMKRLFEGCLAGDPELTRELMEKYGRSIRAVVRRRLRKNPAVRGPWDSQVICNMVFSAFHGRYVAGDELPDPSTDIPTFLAAIARNVTSNVIRGEQAACRDVRRLDRLTPIDAVASPAPGPQTTAERRELLEFARKHLTPEEFSIIEQHYVENRSWEDLAQEHGTTSEALRKKIARAIQRVREELQDED